MNTQHIAIHQEFYGKSLFDMLMINFETYRGRGRPRKIDYIPFIEAQKKLNKILSNHINKERKSL